MSVARPNLKEAVCKTLVRRTGRIYEAAAADERAKRLKVQFLHGNCGSRCGGHKRGSQSVIAEAEYEKFRQLEAAKLSQVDKDFEEAVKKMPVPKQGKPGKIKT